MFNGVAYQLMWTLFSAVRLQAQARRITKPGHPQSASLVIEPLVGSDLELQEHETLIRMEIKARSAGPWSLRELVDNVLPTLFADGPGFRHPSSYQFVTDGRLGGWREQVYEAFFRSLKTRPVDWSAPQLALDDTTLLPYLQRCHSLAEKIQQAGYGLTERGLFFHIADRVLSSSKHGRRGSASLEYSNLYRQLSAFEILERRMPDELYPEVRHALSARGVPDEELDAKLGELCFALLERAARGPTYLEPNSFLLEHGVGVLPLSHWSEIIRRGMQALEEAQTSRGYDARTDSRVTSPVGHRLSLARGGYEGKTPHDPKSGETVLVLLGTSGQGKSWVLDRAAREISRRGEVAIVLETTGDVERDRAMAAKWFCERIWQLDQTLSLERLAAKVGRFRSDPTSQPWLTVFFDGVLEPAYVQRLARAQWSSLGVRPVVAITTEDTDEKPYWLPTASLPIHLSDFTKSEIIRFLRFNLPTDESMPPDDVRDLIRRPVLARLFVDSVGASGGWQPEAEYELLERYWLTRTRHCRIAAEKLVELAADLLDQWTYPWTASAFRAANLNDNDLARFRSIGLLLPASQGRLMRVWHDRLLQWMVAEGLVARLDRGAISSAEFVAKALIGVFGDGSTRARFGYVPMDVLWLASDPGRSHADVVVSLLEGLEGNQFNYSTLSTAGARIVPHIFARLRQLAGPLRYRTLKYLEILEASRKEDVISGALDLLANQEVPCQKMAVRLLKTHGSALALDRIWQLYRQWSEEVETRLSSGKSQEREPGGVDFSDVANAEECLRICVREQPAWLEQAILQAGEDHIHTLLYLLPWVEIGEDLWHRVKDHAIATVQYQRERCVAFCINRFADRSTIDWLDQRLDHPKEFVAPWARSAMYLLEPGKAVRPVRAETLMAESSFRRLWLPWMQLERLEYFDTVIRESLGELPDPWDVANLFDGRESWVPEKLLEILLDDTAAVLRRELEHPSEKGREPLYRRFRFLGRISNPALLEQFWQRAGTPFERDLVSWLVGKGANDGRGRRLTPEAGRALLAKIGGDGIALVANNYLRQGKTHLGRKPGVSLALRCADEETIRLLERIATDPEPDTLGVSQPFPISQRDALEVLATLGCSDAVVAAVRRIGAEVSRELPAYLGEARVSDVALAPALSDLEAPEGPSPGSVIAVGLSRRLELAPRLRRVLQDADPDSDVATCCIFALEILGDNSLETIEVLRAALDRSKTYYSAWVALLAGAGTNEAFEALFEYLRAHLPVKGSRDLALNLLANRSTQLETARLLWTELDPDSFRNQFGDRLEFFAELDDHRMDDLLLEVAFDEGISWRRSSPASAIRGLGRRDPQRAFEAATVQLKTGPFSERLQYPSLLLHLDSERAVKLFAELLATSGDLALVRAIGDALGEGGHESVLLGWLCHSSEYLRQGACLASASFRWSEALDTSLLKCLRDPSWRVRDVSSPALETLREERLVQELIAMLGSEANLARRWAILDAALELGDPWVVPGANKGWIVDLCKGLPFTMKQYAGDRIRTRRKEILEQLERQERD